MEYQPLKQFNPSETDVTRNSSVFFAQRGLMPGKGNSSVSFPNNKVIGYSAMRTMDFSAVFFNGLIGVNSFNTVVADSPQSLTWQGCWLGSGGDAVIVGHCSANRGLIAPFNMFGIGKRYKKNWRPDRDVS